MTQVVLLDIEGTTTPIDFVTRTLFPYARARLEVFLRAHQTDARLASVIQDLRALHAAETDAPPFPAGDDPLLALPYLHFLMDHDRKVTPLKALQGWIWRAGYESGELHGEVYDDVPPALNRWQAQGRRTAIYSSGSVEAQQLLFRHSTAGDLTPYLSEYFDTTTGPKQDAASYAAIAAALGMPATEVMFLSDHLAEVAAARAAGMQARQVVRGSAQAAEPEAVCDFATVLYTHRT